MIQICKMDPAHIAEVARLEQLCFSCPWSEASLTSELTNPLALWLVAEEDGRVVGYVGSQTVMDEADMMNLAVEPSLRRKGIARQLVEALLERLRQQGAVSLTLEVRASNEAAIALYESMGFTAIGRRPGYYRAPREDAWILRKEWTL